MFKRIFEELKKDKFLTALVSIFLIFSLIYIVSYGLLNTVMSKKAVLGLKINKILVGGKTDKEIRDALKAKVDAYKKETIIFNVESRKYEIKVSDLEPDYHIDETIEKALNYGKNTYDPRQFAGGEIKAVPTINEEAFKKFYSSISAKENTAAVDSKIVFSKEEITFSDEKEGKGVKETSLRSELEKNLQSFAKEGTVFVETLQPKITKEMLSQNKEEISDFLEKPLVISVEGFKETISKETLTKWLGFENNKGTFKLVIDKDTVKEYLKGVALKIKTTPVNAQLTIKDGKASVFVPSKNGKKLDEGKSLTEISENALVDSEVKLVVVTEKAEVTEENLNDLGIKELVATGTSDFTGSPNNRKHNVKTGASKFNGILIKPDETFSFNKHLGEVDAANGYLPELVILQNKTEPQYGGGLCQVSSTAFRAALNAGLPIVARLNHAYPVKYYYPIGADATIYLPNPDLKFKNDTGSYILIQTSIAGNILKFDFYGTKPARTVKFSGDENGVNDMVDRVENVKPHLYNHDQKGKGSVDSIFYRFMYDQDGKLVNKYKTLSKYDSPDKYPKTAQ